MNRGSKGRSQKGRERPHASGDSCASGVKIFQERDRSANACASKVSDKVRLEKQHGDQQ